MTSLTPPRSLSVERQRLDLPSPVGGVRDVHLVQVAGEQVGLLAALGAPDLDDHRPTGVRVGQQQQLLQLVVDRGEVVVGRIELDLEQLAVDGAGADEQFLGRVAVGAPPALADEGVDERPELPVPGGHDAQLGRIGGQRGVGEARLEVAELQLSGGESGGDRAPRRHSARACRKQASSPEISSNLELYDAEFSVG